MNKYYDENSKIAVDVKGLRYTVFLDEVFEEAAYQRDVISILNNATEEDSIIFMINSDGGTIHSVLPIIVAIRESKATVTGMLLSECHSAASVVFLATDNQMVNPHCSMLIHSASYGIGGKQQDIYDHVEHSQKRLTNMFNDFYYGFLSEDEISEVLRGKELYLDYDDICERLQERDKIFKQEHEEFLEEFAPPSREELLKMTKKQILDIFMGEEG